MTYTEVQIERGSSLFTFKDVDIPVLYEDEASTMYVKNTFENVKTLLTLGASYSLEAGWYALSIMWTEIMCTKA